ncbi:hypothetical protein Nepgr_000027 [Nepenthes gracilis]|uniref:Uncharacterized protein n=1 Tax=Nepenthes gracilis TaxID=150966 RepID=A0AAD3RWE6_NEPGR|nr:hypothetical protein Nepgr_000027 [Nepenthes gracilis]
MPDPGAYHSSCCRSLSVQIVTRGTRHAVEQRHMPAYPCRILLATLGRLRDHLEHTAGFVTQLMGFHKNVERRIAAAVPKQRQTLLLSATVLEEVQQICHIALKSDREFINTVQEGSEETHSQVLFCTMAMVTTLAADLLGKLHLNAHEIHSRKPQSY